MWTLPRAPRDSKWEKHREPIRPFHKRTPFENAVVFQAINGIAEEVADGTVVGGIGKNGVPATFTSRCL